MKHSFTFIALLTSLILTACQDNQPPVRVRALQSTIDAMVERDVAALATFQSTYNLVYKNVEPGSWVPWSMDKFYVREELAQVPYGYQLDDIKILVKEEQGVEILQVSLPKQPARLPIDRRIISSDRNCSNCAIKDKEGNVVDVDAKL